MARRQQYIFAEEQHHGRGVLIALLVVLVLLFSGLFTWNFALNHTVTFTKQYVTITNLPTDLENFTILHLSDLNGQYVGDKQSAIKKAIGTRSVSCIVLSGNMVGEDGDVQPLLDLLAILPPSTPTLLIPGDGDPALYATTAHATVSPYADWAQQLQSAGVTILDVPVSITRGDEVVWFVPERLYSLDIDATQQAYQNQLDGLNALVGGLTADEAAQKRNAEYQISRMNRLREIIATIKDDHIQIAVSHLPLTRDYVTAARASVPTKTVFSMHRVSLILCGGYCGGQWRLPGLGAVYVPELGFFPEDSEVMGLGYLNGIWQYISPGLTASPDYPWFMPFRLFNSPGVAMHVLTTDIY
ncbi:MAG: hypothetical protein IJ438_00840 [Clostridia bacterium]|nr:hypothetical protein [Clostridia bacterium]